MRLRRIAGVLERALLGAAMSVVLSIAERRIKDRRDAGRARVASRETESAKLPSPGGAAPLYLKAGMHHGPCIAVTLNDRLDYFGSVVNLAARLERSSSGKDVVISDAIRHDPEVAELLSAPDSQLVVERFEARLKGFDEDQFYLWRVTRSSAGAS